MPAVNAINAARRPSSHRWPHARERGTILIVALLLSAAIAVSIGSYLRLTTNAIKLSTRTFYSNTAMNMAETGVEEAVWCFNQVAKAEQAGTSLSAAFAASWDAQGWTRTGSTNGNATRTFTDFTLPGNMSGNVKVFVKDYYPGGVIRPIVVALATVNIPNGDPITKEIEVEFRRRSRYEAAVEAAALKFKGNSDFGSWNSAKDDDGVLRASPVAFSPSVKHDKCGIACSTMTLLDAGNADIYGSAATAGSTISYIDVGPTGRIGPFGTDARVIDPDRVTTDFVSQIEPMAMPSGGTALSSFGTTLGTTGVTAVYRSTTGILGPLTVSGNVTLYIDVAPGQYAINLSGTDAIAITAGSKLTIYSPGNVDATGNTRINNLNAQPGTFHFYGTSTSTSPVQTIDVGGNTDFNGVIDAPKANVTVHGNINFSGAIVGGLVTFDGGVNFHYDEALAEEGGANPYRVNKWRELRTVDDRSEYTTAMSGW